jgi:hypothetical protein
VIKLFRQAQMPMSIEIILALKHHCRSKFGCLAWEEEIKMRVQILILAAFGGLALGACAQKEKQVAVAPPPPPMPGAVLGSTAADRDGDGIVDGYYTSDGMYHANMVPSPPLAPLPVPTRKGERG